MLRDPKSFAIVENFAGQWLQFRNIDVVRPDPGQFPLFDDGLRYSMRRETELFLDSIIRNDRSILELLDAHVQLLNERLARFYGVAGVSGPEFRRVDMSQTAARRRHPGPCQPAHRDFLLHPNLSSAPRQMDSRNAAERPAARAASRRARRSKRPRRASRHTLRQQMEAHRKSPVCSSCHSRMDPLGFGLENFNAIGAWRTQDGKFTGRFIRLAARTAAPSGPRMN